MRLLSKSCLSIVLSGLLAGCGLHLWWGNRSTMLAVGMSKQDVQTMLGRPQQVMAQELNGLLIETWRYASQTIIFQNGIVQSWTSSSQRSDVL